MQKKKPLHAINRRGPTLFQLQQTNTQTIWPSSISLGRCNPFRSVDRPFRPTKLWQRKRPPVWQDATWTLLVSHDFSTVSCVSTVDWNIAGHFFSFGYNFTRNKGETRNCTRALPRVRQQRLYDIFAPNRHKTAHNTHTEDNQKITHLHTTCFF